MLIAIIGLIASGKSTYAAAIRAEGDFTVNADDLNKELLADKNYQKELKSLFPQCFNEDGLDKRALKLLVFEDAEARIKLEKLAHPRIMRKIKDLERQNETVYAEITAPNKNILADFDYVILISAPYQTRKARAIARDGICDELFDKITAAQPDEMQLRAWANEIIYND